MKRINLSHQRRIGFGAFALALLLASPVLAYTGEKLAKEAKISIAEARAIALKAHPGKITDEELEREAGGTGLRYSFDIKSGSSTQEVGVDARTGRVLENAREGGKIPTRGDRLDESKIGSTQPMEPNRILATKGIAK